MLLSSYERDALRTRFAHCNEFPGWSRAEAFISELIARYASRTILEVGSGANPTLDPAALAARGIRYITSDIDPGELEKARLGHEMRVLDLEGETLPEDLLESCDLVFSRMVNEHVRDGRRYHRNINALLAPGGIAAHCHAALGALPFLVNRLLPDALSDWLLDIVAPRDCYQHGRFRAHYNWCRGPTAEMVRRFEALGYRVLSYDGYFGHGYYRRLGPLHALEQAKTRLLVSRPVPQLCSYATVVLQKAPAKPVPETGIAVGPRARQEVSGMVRHCRSGA
jgi:SAM-dependent methyltransferase